MKTEKIVSAMLKPIAFGYTDLCCSRSLAGFFLNQTHTN